MPSTALLGAGGAGAVPDGPSHRVADALHGQCWHLRPAPIPMLSRFAPGCYVSFFSWGSLVVGCGAGLSCDGSGIMELGTTKCSFDSESTELLKQ